MQYKNKGEILIPFYNFIEDDLYITTFGYTNFSHIDEPFKEYRIRHHHSVSFVVNGEGILYVGKKKYKVQKGDIFILPKNSKTKYYPVNQNNWEYFWFDFNGLKSEEYLNLIDMSKDKCVSKFGNLNDIIYQCESIISRKHKNANIGYYEVLSAFYNAVDLIVKNKNNSTLNTNLKESITNYIKLHYSRPSLTIDEICNIFNISHSYLCKIFKKYSNLTAKGTIIKIRLKEAEKLLLNTNLSIKQIAFSVGFYDDTYFMKTFKKEYHITPSEYRLNNIKNHTLTI